MAVPQLVLDAIRFLLALAAPAALVALVLAGIALRREGTTSFSVGGGGFSKWMFWAIVMITLPQVFGWFAFWGVGAPLPGGGIGNGWMSGFANDAVIGAINTAITNVIGAGLRDISGALGAVNGVLNAIQNFFQNTIYPPDAINRARGVVGEDARRRRIHRASHDQRIGVLADCGVDAGPQVDRQLVHIEQQHRDFVRAHDVHIPCVVWKHLHVV